jgi:hypothetical protein
MGAPPEKGGAPVTRLSLDGMEYQPVVYLPSVGWSRAGVSTVIVAAGPG